MPTDHRVTGKREPPAMRARAHLFTVRLWREEGAGEPALRGNVRDAASGAYRHFRDWSDLTAFMLARLDEAELTGIEQATKKGTGHDV